MKRIIKMILIALSVVFVLFLVVFCFLFVGSAKAKEITWGVDFSQMQAQNLKLDWKELYLAMINDLGVKNIKIHTQWDWVEGSPNKYYFNDIDWQLLQAKQNGVKIIYVVGIKSGRWPECHIPGWANNLSEQQEKDTALDYIKQVVQRYKNEQEITYWQVENEPLFKFGDCPSWYYNNKDFLKQEVALVKSLDPSRKVIVSDSGEGSLWFGAAKIGDIVGTTMYREAWAHISDSFGFYFHYFFSPVYYSRKALLIKKIFGKDVICIEFQAEPWASKPFYDVSLAEQNKTMNLQIFKDNIQYAKQTGFDTFYFWGVEWWYWMKTIQNQPAIWNEAKQLFK
jgi:endo-1,4-beta-mannosidase